MSGMSDLAMEIENLIYDAVAERAVTENDVVKWVQARLRERMRSVPDEWIRNVYDYVMEDWFANTDLEKVN